MNFRIIKEQVLAELLASIEGLDSDQLVKIGEKVKRRLGGSELPENDTIRLAARQLLQFRPLALKRFEDMAVTGRILGFYYDLSNNITPALFVIIERNGDEETEMIRLEGSDWKRPLRGRVESREK